MLKRIVYSLYLLAIFYLIIMISILFGWYDYPQTTFSLMGPLLTFLALFGTVNNVLVKG
jgi:hypothetical protein